MIVLDASAIVMGLLNDGDSREYLAREAVAVPHLVDSELSNALRAQVIRNAISEDQGRQALSVWSDLGVRRFPTVGLLVRMWELRENLTAYDATYVALAENLDTRLVTADARLSLAPGPECPITVLRR